MSGYMILRQQFPRRNRRGGHEVRSYAVTWAVINSDGQSVGGIFDRKRDAHAWIARQAENR
jgi:hypothetical protein